MPNYIISLTDAEAWARSWQSNPPKNLAKAHLIPKAVFEDLINTTEVVSIRAYMGVDSGGVQRLMFVGVDGDDVDITDPVYCGTQPCPPVCDTSSPLYNP